VPITFSVNYDDGYLTCTYIGKIRDEELYGSWEKFYGGELWKPGLMELADNRNADFSEISSDGIRRLAKLCKSVFEKNHINSVQTAMCCDNPLGYGLSRMYESFTFDSPENSRVFKNMDEAKTWLKSQLKEQEKKIGI